MRKHVSNKIRVGIIGANPDRGWAMQAHIPALKSLSDDFEITALSTSRRESAAAAGKLFGVPLAFDNHHDLVNSAAVDVVAITVKVPYHFELAADALTAGKAVYCEWPLGNGLEEAERLAALAEEKGVLAVVGAGDCEGVCSGLVEGGAAFPRHYRRGVARGTDLVWEINGTGGDLPLTALGGQAQIFQMAVHGGKGKDQALQVMPVPEQYRW